MRRVVLIWMWGITCALCCQKADAAWQTNKAIGKAREALNLGLLKQWKQALLQGDAYFSQEKQKMSLQVRTNTAMWLQLLWSKYYQYKGIMPSIRNISAFEDQKALQTFIKRFDRSIDNLRKSYVHLRQYNSLYTQAMDRSKLSSQVYLQASLSLARDLEERIRSGKIYLAFLRYAHKNWGNKKKIQQRLDNQQLDLRQHKRDLERSIRRQLSLDKEQRKLASSVKSAQVAYAKLEARVNSQRAASITLITIGSVLAAAGLGVGGYAVYEAFNFQFLLKCDQNETPCITGRAGRSGGELEQQNSNNYILIGAAGGVAALGVTLLIIGIVKSPKAGAADGAVIKSHNKHLDYERKRANKRSRRRSQRLTPQRQWQISAAPTPRNAHTLGRW